MKTFFLTLIFILTTTLVFSQDSLAVKSNSQLIKIGHEAISPVKQGRMLAFNSTSSLYSLEPNHFNSILPDFHVKTNTEKKSLTQVKIGYPILVKNPELNSNMPIMVPDSTIKYQLKIAGSN